MRNLLVLLIFTLTFNFNSCNNTIKVFEIIDIKTTKDSIDIDYQNLSTKILKINRQQIIEKINSNYPDINKNYVDRIQIRTVKKTESLRKEICDKKTKWEKSAIYIEIVINYEKSKAEQARQIIKYSKTLIMDELTKLDIKFKKE